LTTHLISNSLSSRCGAVDAHVVGKMRARPTALERWDPSKTPTPYDLVFPDVPTSHTSWKPLGRLALAVVAQTEQRSQWAESVKIRWAAEKQLRSILSQWGAEIVQISRNRIRLR
jgi:hypothetical protein